MSNLIENTEAQIKKTFKILKLTDTKKEEILQKYKSPKNFIEMYFKKSMPPTESINKDGSAPKRIIRTSGRANRSIPDLYSLLRYYYPDVKLVTLLKLLDDGISKNKIGQGYCHDINRIVLYKGEYYTNNFFSVTLYKVWKSKNSPTFAELIICLKSNE